MDQIVVRDGKGEKDRITMLPRSLEPALHNQLERAFHLHQADLAATAEATTTEMIELAKRAEQALEAEYHPDGFNIGLNLGSAAGAGVAAHLHLHVVPRWLGDANFVSIVGETRVLPEDLQTTYDRLKRHF